MIDGRFNRAIAITQPGMFLSQPGSAIRASYHCAPMTVSIESAIRSRDWSEKLIPSVPIEMPSETPIALNRMPTNPAFTTPCFTSAARSLRCILQGLPSYQLAQMPTWAFCMSASVRPVANNIAWLAPWLLGWVIRELYLFRLVLMSDPNISRLGHTQQTSAFGVESVCDFSARQAF